MKTPITILLILLACLVQAQNGINYKAVISDGSETIVADQEVSLQFTILEGATSVYVETHILTTDANGIVIANIGEGTAISGDFSNIAWSIDQHYLNVQVDTGSGLTDMGTTEFKAVPYALSSADAVWENSGDDIFRASGNVGIGTANPFFSLDVHTEDKIGINLSATYNEFNSGSYNSLQTNSFGTSNAIIKGSQNTIANSGSGNHIGNSNVLYGTGTGKHYGVSNQISGVEGEVYGISSTLSNGSDDDLYGVYSIFSGSGLGDIRGVETRIVNTGDGAHRGLFNHLNGSGSGEHHGVYNELLGTGTGEKYGTFNTIGASGDAFHYGNYNVLYGGGSGRHFGTYNGVSGNGSGIQYGTFNIVTNNGNNSHYGSYNHITNSGAGNHVTAYNLLGGSGSGNQIGTRNIIVNSGGGEHYGMLNNLEGSGNGDHYGIYNTITGSGSGLKYGIYSIIPESTGGSHIALYSKALQNGGFAGYFEGNFRQESGNAVFLDNVGIGTTSPDRKLSVSGSANFNEDQTGGRVALRVQGDEALWYNGTYFSWGFGGAANYFTDPIGIGDSTPDAALDVVGSIQYTGSITDVSDRRLKENFKPIDKALTKLLAVKTYTYNMKNEDVKQREYGIIAQELQKLFPEMVSSIDSENDYLGVSYIQLVPVLIKALQEQQRIISEQTKKNNDLSAQISLLNQNYTDILFRIKNLETKTIN